MGMVYVAINGDSVGSKIGEAILSDDHQALAGLSKKFKDAHSNIEKWAQRKGGEVVASAGDESIFSLPEEMIGELENIKSQYSQASGTTLTIGIGQTISQASKALIYGKLNSKDQIVEYEPQMDDYISGDQEDETDEEGTEVDNGEEEFGDEDEAGETGEEFGDDEEGEEGEGAIPSPEDIDGTASDENRQHEGLEGEAEFGDEDSGEEFGGEGEEDILDEEDQDETQPPHEQEMSPAEGFAHDAEENEDDEQDADDIEADEESEAFGGNTEPLDDDFAEDTMESADDQIQDQEAEGLEGEAEFGDEDSGEEFGGEGEEEFGDESSDDDIQELSADDIASQENPEGEEGFENEEGQDPYGQDQDGEEFYQEGEDQGMEDQGMEDQGMEGQEDEGSEADDFLNEMMHSNMDGQEQDPETAELKQKIFTALQSLKSNREMLDQMQVQNPELYQGIMANIQSMIEMGKKLGMGGQEGEDQGMEGQDPNAMQDQGMEQEDPYAQEQEMETAPVKKPQGSFPA